LKKELRANSRNSINDSKGRVPTQAGAYEIQADAYEIQTRRKAEGTSPVCFLKK
jgi:hypothetical protein